MNSRLFFDCFYCTSEISKTLSCFFCDLYELLKQKNRSLKIKGIGFPIFIFLIYIKFFILYYLLNLNNISVF